MSLSRWLNDSATRIANAVPSALRAGLAAATSLISTLPLLRTQPRDRGFQTLARRGRLVAALLGVGDHLGLRLGAEPGIGQVGLEFLDFLAQAVDLAAQACALRRQVDDAGEVEEHGRLADHDLRPAQG